MALPTSDAPERDEMSEVWLSVGDFAAARRLSTRTVKRYIEAGDVETKKENGRRFVRDFEKGQKGHAQRDTAKVPKVTDGTPQKGHEGEGMSLPVSLHAQSEGQKGQSESVKRDTLEGEARELARLRADLEREREGVAFLRGVIEQLQRDGAETRNALRKALELAPKQLAAPSPVKADETARNAPQSQLSNKSGSYSPDALEGAKTGGEGDGAGVSYASIADELERMLNG